MIRAAPPAITPVPAAAGFIITRPAPVMPMIGCVMVLPASGHRTGSSWPLRCPSGCQRHFLGLAVPETDATIAIADHDQRGERETTAALDDLGDAVDVDDARLAQATRSTGVCRAGVLA
jgi:hypothetical protein